MSNALEKATFITIYDKSMNIASLTRDRPDGLPGIARESSSVAAIFNAKFCAESAVLLITRSATNSAYWNLPWLPGKQMETIGGLTVTQAVDEIVKLAKEWRDHVDAIVYENAPGYEVVMTPKPEPEATPEQDDAEPSMALAVVAPSKNGKKARGRK